MQNQTILPQPAKKTDKKKLQKIGRPGYKLSKFKDPETGQRSILFEIDYPEITKDLTPKHRIMSSYEQKVLRFHKLDRVTRR